MKIEEVTQTLPDFPPVGIMGPHEKALQPIEDIPLELLIASQAQEPIIWPRVFPGL
jgi:hypothetical protein